ncbi:MAG: NAD-dependent epimerase/dehydratase family protein [Candidatus Omnitrophota bacterium]|nr:NAD-dependent epimerase/dehydratase family protein [Candidatus Omnitrophota bacterium]
MKVLVTGGCGFLGSWVCEYYRKKGDAVIAYDNMTKNELMRTGYNVERARDYNWNYLKSAGVDLVKADVRNKEELFEYAKSVDFIIHTAAQPAMTISIENPELDATTNVIGTFNVLEAARTFKIPAVSCATVHVYGNRINKELKQAKTRYVRKPSAIAETYPTLTGTLTPLHASKASADIYVRTYIDTFKVKAASFRFTGLYGERQLGGEDHGWVANFCIRALMGMSISIYGTGKQVRDILYAEDAARAFDAFYRKQVPGIYNIGGSRATMISLRESIKIIAELTGKKIDATFGPERLGDLRYFVCDTRKARKAFGWSAAIKPREGISRLIAWIEKNRSLFQAS